MHLFKSHALDGGSILPRAVPLQSQALSPHLRILKFARGHRQRERKEKINTPCGGWSHHNPLFSTSFSSLRMCTHILGVFEKLGPGLKVHGRPYGFPASLTTMPSAGSSQHLTQLGTGFIITHLPQTLFLTTLTQSCKHRRAGPPFLVEGTPGELSTALLSYIGDRTF